MGNVTPSSCETVARVHNRFRCSTLIKGVSYLLDFPGEAQTSFLWKRVCVYVRRRGSKPKRPIRDSEPILTGSRSAPPSLSSPSNRLRLPSSSSCFRRQRLSEISAGAERSSENTHNTLQKLRLGNVELIRNRWRRNAGSCHRHLLPVRPPRTSSLAPPGHGQFAECTSLAS